MEVTLEKNDQILKSGGLLKKFAAFCVLTIETGTMPSLSINPIQGINP
ncbi:hypothetical protein [Adhaeribacter pallidiroseus]|nr:hypothetical protein [Adhaeribacter pallidiroseus]